MLTLIGQCPVGDDQVRQDLAEAIRTGELTALTRWPGSYLVLVRTRDELVAFSDLAGQHPLYFHHDGTRLVFGTGLLATAAAAGLPAAPDAEVVLAEIFCAAVPSLVPGRTPVVGVRRLEAAQAMRVTAAGDLRLWTYDELGHDEGQDVAGCAAGLASELDTAVGWRMRAHPRVSADFSGGLDSTSVAFLAVRHRQDRRLPVFVYSHPAADAGDLPHALSGARLNPLLELTVVRGGSDTLAYQDLTAAAPTDVPDFAVAVHARNRLRLRHAAASGSFLHLGGEGADALLVAPPAYLGDLAGRFQFRQLVADASAWGAARQESSAAIVARAVRLAKTSMSAALRLYATELDRSHVRHPRWIDAISWWPGPGVESSWLAPRARTTLVELVRQRAEAVRGDERRGVADFQAAHDLRRSAEVQHRLDRLAREHRIWPQAPFLDNNVIRACTRVPTRQRAQGATLKPLLREAMRERVPSAVLTRQSKGNYCAEDNLGVRRAARELRQRLPTSPLAELGLIDPDAVLSTLHRASAGTEMPFPALNRLVAYDVWLRCMS
ncbi:asparagine synthase-related protein [Nocardia sp. NRRL S-836]|uniref:asparagine synthase-related protein n=1 Tax=Nocardia sp. NRRL S-836 TaxID=1519492 RepID=UPI0012FC1E19|nr:asparagine synthase-related protein [Nocardia sp. NRRL S-836]